ncbi:hypothetical protein B0J13DRAFT_567842 [Dactylonectria estremocensis]|uniref:NADH:flavin oxidoreductase/NADH oxidase N-terminal domain-containing protein n=1 Tax=Dactylonectria estremocensis TaxID=1079267 RepID=A0A9P9DJI8_9HYPO|nr:hypothetical protein B0J13DRAFT_567842 [Dactylonectria estremocensis]
MTSSESRLWQPLKVGNLELSHRIAMAPLTRYRNDDNHAPLDMMIQYYADRASTPGTLIISEATGVSQAAEADPNLPGITTEEQIAGWKRIYEAVHAKGSFMFQQIWDLGRAGNPGYVKGRGFKYASSSSLQMEGRPEAPEALTEEEIWQKIADFRNAAKNVVAAGGDGVEIHGAHGYLVDQFTRESVNSRTDKWGGSVENRARFLLEVVKAIVEEVGAERTALRLSPFATFQGSFSKDTWEQTSYIIRELKKAGYKLAYISLVEPRGNPINLGIATPQPLEASNPFGDKEQKLEFVLEEWDNQSPVFVAGAYTPDMAAEALDGQYKRWDVGVAFGRPFISNPDLVFRAKNGVPFTPYDRTTFYDKKNVVGYNDYPFSEEYLAAKTVQSIA